MSAKGSDIKAGAAFVELFVKDEKLRAGLKSAQSALKAFGHTLTLIGGLMAAAGAAILAPLAAAVRSFTAFGSQLNDMSMRTGLSAQSLAELAYAAQQTGTSLEDVEKALRFMAKNGLDPRRFDDIAAEIAAIEDPTRRVQRAFEAWGKAGTMLLPMIANLKSLRAKARELGIIFTDDQIKLADDLGDAFDDITTAIKATAFQVGAALAPVLIPILDLMRGLAIAVGTAARDFPVLTQVVAALGVVLAVVGSALAAIGIVLAVVLPAIAALITVVGAVGVPVALGVAACVALTAALWAMLAAMVASVAAFLLFTKAGQQIVEAVLKPIYWWLKRWQGLGDVIKKTFSALGEAIKAGDMGKAWDILVLGMTAAWHEFTARVLTDISVLIEAFKRLASLSGAGLIVGLIADPAAAFAKGKALDAQIAANAARDAIKNIRQTLPSGKGNGDPSDYKREQSAAVIGFNARSALMGRQVIGAGRDEQMLDTMTKILLASATSAKELKEIKDKLAGRFK